MPRLGDFLGQLLAEVTEARLQADAEALRVAELYSSHPLLCRFPVPRFRLPEVEVDVPVVVSDGASPVATGGAPPRPTVDDTRRRFDDALAGEIARSGVRLADDTRRRLETALDTETRGLARPAAVDIDAPTSHTDCRT